MIVRPRPDLFDVLFTLRGSVLPKITPKVLGVMIFSFAVVAVERTWPEPFPTSGGVGPFTLIGLALSIFLSFRNGACYDRWWEARRAWGTLIVETRGLSRLIRALLNAPDQGDLRRRATRRLSAFAHALHARLRDTDGARSAASWLPESEANALVQRESPSDAILSELSAELSRELAAGRLTDIQFSLFEQKIASLSAIQATCERIHLTPLPFTYTLLLYRTAWLYCLLLPFGLAASLGWASPIAAGLVAYTFFGLDALGDELEDPFGKESNDLPLDALLHAVDSIVHEALGEPAPRPPRVDGHLLL